MNVSRRTGARRLWLLIAVMNLAQLPVAMRALILVLLGHQVTGSFAVAGVGTATAAVCSAATAPLFGRLLGRHGHRNVLLATGTAFTAALVALAASRGTAAFVALAALVGLASPPLAGSVRALLPGLTPAAALSRAYTLNAVAQEVLYVGGPLWIALCSRVTDPRGVLLATTALGAAALLGSLAFVPGTTTPPPDAELATPATTAPPTSAPATLAPAATAPASATTTPAAATSPTRAPALRVPATTAPATRTPAPRVPATTAPAITAQAGAGTITAPAGAPPATTQAGARNTRAPSPLRRPAVRTLVAVRFGYAVCMGAMWVLIPAFAAALGRPGAATLLVSLWSLGSLVGGAVASTRGRWVRPDRAHHALLALLTLTALPLAMAGSVPQMAVAVALFGLGLAPWLAVADELVSAVAPRTGAGETYGWLLTAGQIGSATGSALTGALADHRAVGAPFLVVVLALSAALGTAIARRHTLRPRMADR